jgi:hypothetical protein
MRHARPATQAAISLAMWPLTIMFSPMILVAGEPLNRYVMKRACRSATAGPAAVIGNPLWIALTAPGRWVSDQFRRPPSM